MAPLSTSSEPILTTSTSKYNQSPSREKVSVKLSVCFHARVRCRKTIHLNEFSDDEISACWYSDQQYSNMKEEVQNVADLIDRGLLGADNTRYCLRGAESKAPLQSRRRRKIRLAVHREVLKEQALQWAEGTLDPEFIARVCQVESARSLAYARRLALEDEVAARL